MTGPGNTRVFPSSDRDVVASVSVDASGHDDEALMAAYVAGDQPAFRALFDRHAPRLLHALTRYIGTREAARDLVQQAFLNVHRARRDFRPGTGFRPWLYTIGFNLARDQHRRVRSRPEVHADPGGADGFAVPGEPGRDPLRDAAVQAALGKLPDAQREVIVLHWFEELDFRTIAGVVGASLSAVKVRAHRGYAYMRQELGDVGDEYRVTGGGRGS